MSAQEKVLEEVAAERARQDAKWGDQSHSYDGTGPDENVLGDWRTASGLRFTATRRTDEASATATGATMAQILLEEVFEAVAEDDPAALRHELVQVAAVSVAWIEYLDVRGGRPLPESNGWPPPPLVDPDAFETVVEGRGPETEGSRS